MLSLSLGTEVCKICIISEIYNNINQIVTVNKCTLKQFFGIHSILPFIKDKSECAY